MKSYFICFTVRSGSSMLCEALTATRLLGTPAEQFYHNSGPHNPAGDPIPDYPGYVRRTLAESATPNGVFGTKIAAGYWHNFRQRLGDNLDLFGDLRYVWLTRRNKARQAVSHWMAIQSGRWHSDRTTTNPEPEYRFDAIDHLVQEMVIGDALWADYYNENHIQPLVIVYEDFVQDLDGTVRRVLDHMDVPAPPDLHVPPPRLKKIADDLSETWVQRYREEKQSGWWTRFW